MKKRVVFLILILFPLSVMGRWGGDGTVRADVKATSVFDRGLTCEDTFKNYHCQRKIDAAGHGRRHEFIDCDKKSNKLKVAAICSGYFAVGAGFTALTMALPGVVLPVVGGVVLYNGLKNEKECFEDPHYRKEVAKPLGELFGQEYANTLATNLSCADLERNVVNSTKKHLQKIGAKRIQQERFEKELAKRPNRRAQLERIFPASKRVLTQKEKNFEKEIEKIKAKEAQMLSIVTQVNRYFRCASPTQKAKIACALSGGLSYGGYRFVNGRLVAAKVAAESSGSATAATTSTTSATSGGGSAATTTSTATSGAQLSAPASQSSRILSSGAAESNKPSVWSRVFGRKKKEENEFDRLQKFDDDVEGVPKDLKGSRLPRDNDGEVPESFYSDREAILGLRRSGPEEFSLTTQAGENAFGRTLQEIQRKHGVRFMDDFSGSGSRPISYEKDGTVYVKITSQMLERPREGLKSLKKVLARLDRDADHRRRHGLHLDNHGRPIIVENTTSPVGRMIANLRNEGPNSARREGRKGKVEILFTNERLSDEAAGMAEGSWQITIRPKYLNPEYQDDLASIIAHEVSHITATRGGVLASSGAPQVANSARGYSGRLIQFESDGKFSSLHPAYKKYFRSDEVDARAREMAALDPFGSGYNRTAHELQNFVSLQQQFIPKALKVDPAQYTLKGRSVEIQIVHEGSPVKIMIDLSPYGRRFDPKKVPALVQDVLQDRLKKITRTGSVSNRKSGFGDDSGQSRRIRHERRVREGRRPSGMVPDHLLRDSP